MNYEQKYKEALGWMQSLYDGLHGPTKEEAEHYFPELKESVDEMIRKRLIKAFGSMVIEQWGGIAIEDILSWLEKQGEQPTDKVEPKFKTGDWITSIDDEGKISTKKIVEFWGDKVRLVDLDEYFTLYPKSELNNYHLWTIQDAKDGDILVASDGSIFLFAGVVDCACKYYVALEADNYVKINKEAKGGYWETSRAVHPAIKEQRVLLFEKMKEAGYEWRQEEKKLIKMKETKFKVGDFIVLYNITPLEIWKVINIDKDGYYNIQPITNIINTEDDETYRVPGFIIEKDYRLWTINDAKDGDLIYVSTEIKGIQAIFHKFENGIIYFHCNLCRDFTQGGCEPSDDVEFVIPLQKTHYQKFFQKMKEAGYEWDAEKKEIKKIEPKILDADEVIDWIDNNICNAYDYDGNDISTTLKNKFKEDFRLC